MHLFNTIIQFIIHDKIVISTHSLCLFTGTVHSGLNNLHRLCPSSYQTGLQFSGIRRCHKHQKRIRELFFHFQCSLNLDLKNHIFPFIQHLLNICTRCAIIVFHVFSILYQFIISNHFFKFLPGKEEIFSAIYFPVTWTSCCRRDG